MHLEINFWSLHFEKDLSNAELIRTLIEKFDENEENVTRAHTNFSNRTLDSVRNLLRLNTSFSKNGKGKLLALA